MHASRSPWRPSMCWSSGTVSNLTRRASCPSRWLNLVCKIPISLLSLSETNTIGLYNLIKYQRRAQHAGQCGVEVEGGRVPTAEWLLNLQILTSGGDR